MYASDKVHACTYTHSHSQRRAFSGENQGDNYKAISKQILAASHREFGSSLGIDSYLAHR